MIKDIKDIDTSKLEKLRSISQKSSVAISIIKMMDRGDLLGASRWAWSEQDKTRQYKDVDDAIKELFGRPCDKCGKYHLDIDDKATCFHCRWFRR